MITFRDAPPEHSTVPFDMEPEILPEGSSVPVNKTSKINIPTFIKIVLIVSACFSCQTEPPSVAATVGADAELRARLRADGCLDHARQDQEADAGLQREHARVAPTDDPV